ncbi:MAG: diacylglycerol kinase [Opitutales bacterium]
MSQESLPEQYRASGFKRVFNALFYSMDGLGTTLKHEEAFRQEMALAAVLIPLALILPVGFFAKALLIGCVMIVLIVELLNSAIEATIDYISTANHYLAKRAKDMGSAAVLLSLLQMFAVWTLVLVHSWPAVSERVESWFSWIGF